MIFSPGFARVISLCLLALLGWAASAEGHRRGGLPLVRPAPSPGRSGVPAPAAEDVAGPLALHPDAYWRRLTALEKAGDFKEAGKTALALVNLFPQASQRGPACLKLAQLAQKGGNAEEALELYGLAAALARGTTDEARARLAAATLIFIRELSQTEPLDSLARFLKEISRLPVDAAPKDLSETLRIGWLAVARKVQAAPPPSLSQVENILALWDMQPKGFVSPEAAQFVAGLLQEKGLWEAARNVLSQAGQGKAPEEGGSVSRVLPLSHGPGLAPLRSWGSPAELHDALLRFLLTGLRTDLEAYPAALGGAPVRLFPRKALPTLDGERVPAFDPMRLSFRPNFLVEGLRYQLAWSFLPTPGVLESPSLTDHPPTGELIPFLRDLEAVGQVRDGRMEAAQATFQELSQNRDPFWQRLARVRLADLELSRLQEKSSP